MDPNETLRMLRLTIKQLRVDEDADVWEAHANEICEYFEALDDWLSRGGFPPEEWREGPDAVGVPLYDHTTTPVGMVRDDDYAPEGMDRTDQDNAEFERARREVEVRVDEDDE